MSVKEGRLFPKMTRERDSVNSPAHYGQGEIECIEYIEDHLTTEEYIGYLRGNIAKYNHRWRYKQGLQDLKKSNWYQKRLIDFIEKGNYDVDSSSFSL